MGTPTSKPSRAVLPPLRSEGSQFDKLKHYFERLEAVEKTFTPMMLYLFDITKFPSNWMHLEMGLTAVSVQTLKEHLESKYKVKAEDQVLLINGGVCLDSSRIVGSYSAGTDSNPIYFFNKKLDKNTDFPECPDVTTTTDELNTLYKKLAKVIPSFQAVIDRAKLAEKFAQSAISIIDNCEEIISDHHTANQGWLAAIANYDDVVANCHKHYEESQKNFERYIGERDYFLNFLEKFKEKLPLFKKIPILQKLLKPNESDNRLMLGSQTSEGSSERESEDTYTSFFDWVGEDEHGNSIDSIYKNCEEEVSLYNEDSFRSAFESVANTLAVADSSNKEINVSFWLSHLDQLINKAGKIVEEQKKISSSIQLNVARMKDCKDLSILPHLCETHEQELLVMNENHIILKEIQNTCIKAKYEFTHNVLGRIGWIVHIENELQHIGIQLDVFNETVERLRYQIAILEKIYLAPTAYFACITETVRRRTFSQAFIMWASEMACRLHTMHNEEVARRKEFLSKYEDTFIQMLFPGLEDLPPSYGTKAPSYFDKSLPKLTIEDIDFLKKTLPDLPKELTECLSSEDSSNLSYYLSFKSILNIQSDKLEEEIHSEHSADKAEVENQNEIIGKSIIKEAGGESSLTAIHGLPHLRDIDRGCESETDTEEFEKVGQSPLELNFNKDVSSQRPSTQDVSTSTEVGERNQNPPKKPPRTFQKTPNTQAIPTEGAAYQRTLSISGSQSNNESFINIKNPSLESIDEISSLKNFSTNTDSCFYSHYQQMPTNQSVHSKPISPHAPLTPKNQLVESPKSPNAGHQTTEFINDEFYIDESLPSSLSIEAGQSQGEFDKQLDTVNNVVALLQDNLEIYKSEYNSLRSAMNQACSAASVSLNQIKSELNEFKHDYNQSKSEIRDFLNSLTIGYEKLCREQENREQFVVQRLTTDHKNEISDFRRLAQVKNEEIKSLRTNLAFLESKLKKVSEDATLQKQNSDEFQKKYEETKAQVSFLENEREKSIRELTERLNREHADKIKTLQSRFKLMTMERTPSESSLEKTLEFSSSMNQESIYIQMKDNFEFEKEKFMKETLLLETEKWRRTVEELEHKYEIEKKSLIESFDREMNEKKKEEMRRMEETEKQFLEEIQQYTNTIKELNAIIDATSKTDQNIEDSKKSDRSENERSVSSSELMKEKTEMVAMTGSSSEGKVDTATSPIKQRKSISKTLNILGKSNKPNVDVLKDGDCLVVVWDEEYQNFRIVQNGPVIYFLHLDCLQPLGLEIYEGSPRRPNKLYCLAEFAEKEYCYARKSENRFNVPQGTRFFRVTVRPLQQGKISQPPPDIQFAESSLSSQQASSISISEMELSPLPPLPKWKYTPNKLPPETFGVVRDNMLEVDKSSDNKSEDSSSSLPFQSANYDSNNQHQESVGTGDDLSEPFW